MFRQKTRAHPLHSNLALIKKSNKAQLFNSSSTFCDVLCTAPPVATKEEEHAVSVLLAGPDLDDGQENRKIHRRTHKIIPHLLRLSEPQTNQVQCMRKATWDNLSKTLGR